MQNQPKSMVLQKEILSAKKIKKPNADTIDPEAEFEMTGASAAITRKKKADEKNKKGTTQLTRKEKLELEELKECTFKPKISEYISSRNISLNSSRTESLYADFEKRVIEQEQRDINVTIIS